ncbi:MAG: hypothetical protein ACQEUI_12165 [Actinomycetota bacterium]
MAVLELERNAGGCGERVCGSPALARPACASYPSVLDARRRGSARSLAELVGDLDDTDLDATLLRGQQ